MKEEALSESVYGLPLTPMEYRTFFEVGNYFLCVLLVCLEYSLLHIRTLFAEPKYETRGRIHHRSTLLKWVSYNEIHLFLQQTCIFTMR